MASIPLRSATGLMKALWTLPQWEGQGEKSQAEQALAEIRPSTADERHFDLGLAELDSVFSALLRIAVSSMQLFSSSVDELLAIIDEQVDIIRKYQR